MNKYSGVDRLVKSFGRAESRTCPVATSMISGMTLEPPLFSSHLWLFRAGSTESTRGLEFRVDSTGTVSRNINVLQSKGCASDSASGTATAHENGAHGKVLETVLEPPY